ncbi:carbohydrate kinase [Chloroflexota bacterium]
MYSLVGIGEMLWDIFPDGKQLGGAPLNFAYHAAALDEDGFVVSSVGCDELGRELLKRLDDLSLSQDYIAADLFHPTGTVSINVGADGSPSYNIRQEAAWDYIPQTDSLMELAKEADAIVFGTLAQRCDVSRTTIRNFVTGASWQTLRILDLNLRQTFYSSEIIEWSLNACNVLKINEDELNMLSNLFPIAGDENKILRILGEGFNLRLIALTRGEKGSVLYSPQQLSVHEGYKTEVVDAVGCWDAFTAALVSGILEVFNLDTINDYANRIASFVCSKRGAAPALPDELKISQWVNKTS